MELPFESIKYGVITEYLYTILKCCPVTLFYKIISKWDNDKVTDNNILHQQQLHHLFTYCSYFCRINKRSQLAFRNERSGTYLYIY